MATKLLCVRCRSAPRQRVRVPMGAPALLAVLGLPFTEVRRGHGAPGQREHVLLAADDATPVAAPHWVLEDGSNNARTCSAGRRGAAEEECLAAVREAASRDGLEVTGLKSVNDGAEGLVPPGCSYSLHSMSAIFNANTASHYIASEAPTPAQPSNAYGNTNALQTYNK